MASRVAVESGDDCFRQDGDVAAPDRRAIADAKDRHGPAQDRLAHDLPPAAELLRGNLISQPGLAELLRLSPVPFVGENIEANATDAASFVYRETGAVADTFRAISARCSAVSALGRPRGPYQQGPLARPRQ